MKQRKFKEPPIKAWSPSRLFVWEDCPRQAMFKFVDKLPEVKGPALERGDKIDGLARAYVEGKIKVLPPELKLVAKRMDELRDLYKQKRLKAQLDVAVTRDWKLTGWFDPDVYARVRMDFMITHPGTTPVVEVVDLKTGKLKTGPAAARYEDQLGIYKTTALAVGFGKEAKSSLLFSDHGKEVKGPEGKPQPVLRLADLPKAREAWDRRASRMLADTRFAPRPGDACFFCSWSQKRGGPCEY